jgi:hypothetical protein
LLFALEVFLSPKVRKIWEDDPLLCLTCGSLMRIVSFITESDVIKKILEYLNLIEEDEERGPPEHGPPGISGASSSSSADGGDESR